MAPWSHALSEGGRCTPLSRGAIFSAAESLLAAVLQDALVLCVPLQAQTPEVDVRRARAEAGDAAV